MLSLALLAAAAATAQPVAAIPLPPPVAIATFDVPQNRGVQEVLVVRRMFPVGSSSGWHAHPGVEVAYLLSGEMLLEMEGQAPRRMRTGDTFTMPRGVAHNGTNRGKVPAMLVITYTLDKGAPTRTPVLPPAP